MEAPTYNLNIEAGTTFRRNLRFYTDAEMETPLDVSTYEIASWITKGRFTIEFDIDMTNASTGQVTISVTPDMTRDVVPGNYLWDFLVSIPGGDVLKFVKGTAVIHPTGTRLEPQ